MTIWLRALSAVILAVALSGCILQSKLPLFGDAQAKRLLADYPNLVAYEKSGQDWVKSKEQFVIAANGTALYGNRRQDRTGLSLCADHGHLVGAAGGGGGQAHLICAGRCPGG